MQPRGDQKSEVVRDEVSKARPTAQQAELERVQGGSRDKERCTRVLLPPKTALCRQVRVPEVRCGWL